MGSPEDEAPVSRETSAPTPFGADAGSVSRETSSRRGPAADEAAARQVFGERLDVALAYADLLATAGVQRGLIGPREVPRLWDRHLLNCAVVADLFQPRTSVADVGSGAGLPGLVLAITRPDLRLVLIEPLLRRATFLTEAIGSLGLANVEVVRSRAEDMPAGTAFDYVTARAVAPLARLVEWCAPLVRRGGELMLMKGATAERELAESSAVLSRIGARSVSVDLVGEGVVDPPTRVVRMTVSRPPRA